MNAGLKAPAHHTVSCLGPGGSHSHLAAIGVFGPVYTSGFRYLPVEPLGAVLTEVIEDRADWAVVPYFNSSSGEVRSIYPALLDVERSLFTQLHIYASLSLPIVHDLLGEGELRDVSVVYSKQEAYDQCRRKLHGLMPHATFVPCASTAAAARRAEREGIRASAVASCALLPFHRHLHLLAQGVQDAAVNITRFLIVCKREMDEIADTHKHSLPIQTWMWFDSSIQDGVLTRVMHAAHQWGLRALPFQGSVTDPVTMKRRFLLEMPWSPATHKVRFFRSETGHLGLARLAHPIVVGPADLAVLQRTVGDFHGIRIQFGDAPHIEEPALALLTASVRERLLGMRDYQLFIHHPVASCEAVWEVLGAPGRCILNTQVCRCVASQQLLFCCVPGDCKVDLKAVATRVGSECKRLLPHELQRLGQCLGAVSPLTAPEGALILFDEALIGCEPLLLGTGHQQVSVATRFASLPNTGGFLIGHFSEHG